MNIPVRLGERSYTVVIERGALARKTAGWNFDRKALVLTDSGVPKAYAEAVAAFCREPYIETVPMGESSKAFGTLERVLSAMLEHGFSRGDCLVTVGGGVVGDLGGFAASMYMRGIDFYNVPTTVLSAVDASVGGKTAIDFHGFKNIVGAFCQPKGVLIDPETFRTLPDRQVSNGLCEAVKTGMIMDKALFELFETDYPMAHLDEIVTRSVSCKRDVVERDEKESDLRRILNFGHTIGHGIENAAGGALYHGECVALGMLPMCSDAAKARLLPVLQKLNLPTRIDLDPAAVYAAMLHDKKTTKGGIGVVRVERIGACRIETVRPERLLPLIQTVVGREAQ